MNIIEQLNSEDIPLYITGSYAVHFYTSKRKYNDIDFVIRKEDIPLIEEILGKKFKRVHMYDGSGSACRLKVVGHLDLSCYDDIVINGEHSNKFKFSWKKYNKCEKSELGSERVRIIDIHELVLKKLALLKNANDANDIILLFQSGKVNIYQLIKESLEYGLTFRLIKFIVFNNLFRCIDPLKFPKETIVL